MTKAAALLERGVQLMQAAQYLEAARAFERAAQQSPRLAEAHALRADALLRGGKPEQARASVDHALRLRPGWGDALVLRGSIEARLGRHADAEQTFRSALGKLGEVPQLRANLGHALRQQHRWAEALDCYELALNTTPGSGALHLWKGEMLWALGRPEEAEQSLRRAISLDENLLDAQRGLAVVLFQLRKYAGAESACRRVLEQDQSLETVGQLADILSVQGRHDEAEQLLRNRRDPAGLLKLGTFFWRSARYEEALDTYRTAAKLANGPEDPRFIESKVDEAVGLLSLARWDEGWEAYRCRYDRRALKATYPDLIDDPSKITHATTPLRIRLRADQGIGDELFFLRFAAALKARGHRLLLVTGRKQISLLSALTDLFGEVQPADTVPPASCDVELLSSDLPLLRQEAVPPSLRFVPEPQRRDRLQRQLRSFGPPPYVGVTWRAGPTLDEQLQGRHTWVYGKQIPIEDLAAVLRPLKATVVVLQRRIAEAEGLRFRRALGREALDLSDVHDDLPETLAALSLLDEYIGVSSTNMHLLAGVDGKRARVLIQRPAEWRWGLEGDSSPWFPGFRIYRQAPDRGWAGALRQLAGDLRPLVAN